MRHPFLSIVCVLLLAENVFADNKVAPEAGTYIVERVIDGATLKLTNGEEVRLIGVDTPVIVFPAGVDPTMYDPPGEVIEQAQRWGVDLATLDKMGQEVKEFVKGLIEGKEVRLEFDVDRKDKYGRLLAYVWYSVDNRMYISYFRGGGKVRDFPTEVMLNKLILSAGYASSMTIPPDVKHAPLFEKLYQEARKATRGLWAKTKENVVSVDYQALAEACQQKESVDCCMASVRAMKENNYFPPTSEDDSINYGCPGGFKRNTMRCIDSFKWCEPVTFVR